MAISLTHTTVAVGTDANNGEIHKAEWNEAHTISMATARLLGRTTAGAGAAEEITVGTGLTLSGGSLTNAGAVLGANTFTGEQNLADNLLTRPLIKDYGLEVNAIGSIGGGTQDIDLTLGNFVTGTVDTSTTTFTFSNPTATGDACGFTLVLTNGGSQTVNWPAAVDWPGGTAPTLTTSGIDIICFHTVDAGTIWYGHLAGQAMA